MMTRSSRWFFVGQLAVFLLISGTVKLLAQDEAAGIAVEAAGELLPAVSASPKPLASLSAPSGGVIFIKRSSSGNQALNVPYTLSGTASNGVDYVKLPGVATILAGATFVPVLIEPIARADVDNNLSVTLTITPDPTYQIESPIRASIMIRYQAPIVNQPPKVNLDVKSNLPLDPHRLDLTAAATDTDGWVKQVDFFDGASLLGTAVQNGPLPSSQDMFTFTWKDSPSGSHSLTARAMDNLGASSTSMVVWTSITVVPIISITSPTNGTRLVAPADVTIEATAIDPDGFIYEANFYDNDVKIGNSSIATLVAPPPGTPAHHSFRWMNVAPGVHTIFAEAASASGTVGRSAPVILTVQNNSLTVTLINPTNNAVFMTPANIPLVAAAESAGVPAQKVQFFAGTKSLGIVTNNPIYSAPHPFQLTWSNAPVGNYVVTAKATDYQGFSVTSAPVNITVQQPNLPILRVVATDPYASDAITNEGGVTIIDSGLFTIYRSGNTNKTVTPSFGVSGTASGSYDYESLYYTVTIPAGVLSTNLVVKPINRMNARLRDTYVILNLRPSSLYTLGSPTSAVVFIENNARTNHTHPSVRIQRPFYGMSVAPVNGSIAIDVYAYESDGWVQQVEVKSGDKRIGLITNDFTYPFDPQSFSMAWTNPPPDVYSLTAIATDNRGVTTTSSAIQFTVTSLADYLAITSPTNNARIAPQQNLAITATAADPKGYVNLVEFYDGPNKIGQASLVSTNPPKSGVPYHYEFTWTNVPAGFHSLIATAKDHAGATIVSDPVYFTASVSESQLTINRPTNGASFIAPATIKIEATAFDPNGLMNIVEFYANETRIGESMLLFGGPSGFPDPGTPLHHTFFWTNVDIGAYTLAAKSVNKAGNPVVSPSVKIQVTTPLSVSYVERKLPEFYQPGVPLTVHLKATPPTTTSAYLVEDQPPEGWTVKEMSHSGVYDAVNHKVKFGLFFDAESRDLTYQATPPPTEAGPKDFIGLCSIDGVSTVVSGQSRISEGNAPSHPADNNPADFVMSANEVTAYSDAWRRGTTWAIGPNPIPASYVTRAGALWKGGEKYAYAIGQPPPLCWINLKLVGTQSINARSVLGVNLSAASCEMPTHFTPGTAVTVSIRLEPAPGVLASVVEDQPPAGWAVAKISDAGVVDPVIGKVKWGPFYTATERTLTYEVTPPPMASGRFAFAGTASCDGQDTAIIGQRQVVASNSGVLATLKSVMRLANGKVQITLAGETGRSYLIESTTNLVDWTSLDTLTGTGDTLQFTDTSAANLGRRFYRAVPVP